MILSILNALPVQYVRANPLRLCKGLAAQLELTDIEAYYQNKLRGGGHFLIGVQISYNLIVIAYCIANEPFRGQ